MGIYRSTRDTVQHELDNSDGIVIVLHGYWIFTRDFFFTVACKRPRAMKKKEGSLSRCMVSKDSQARRSTLGAVTKGKQSVAGPRGRVDVLLWWEHTGYSFQLRDESVRDSNKNSNRKNDGNIPSKNAISDESSLICYRGSQHNDR